MRRTVSLLLLLASGAAAPAHDLWLQTNTAVVRTGEAVHIDLMLGNHGNDHRDYRLASKAVADGLRSLAVTGPDGTGYDLRPTLADLGYTPKEGFHSARFVTGKPGVYVAALTADRVVNHGTPARSVSSAKTYFLAADTLDRLPKAAPGKPLGHRFELVPETDLLTDTGPGRPLAVRALLDGKPLAGATVAFIPRGVTLKAGTDPDHERTTDAAGRANFTPTTGTYHLIVARHATADRGEGYEATRFTATLTVLVPQLGPCRGE